MKKNVLLGVLLLGIFSFTACGDAEVAETPDASVEITTTDEVTVEEPKKKNKMKDLSKWGYDTVFHDYHDDTCDTYEIRFSGEPPKSAISFNYMVEDYDNCLVTVVGQIMVDLEELQWEGDLLEQIVALREWYICHAMWGECSKLQSVCDLTVETTEKMEINGYEMCKYTGNFNCLLFSETEEEIECPYVGYAARLSPEQIVYWFYFAFDPAAEDKDTAFVTEKACKKIDEFATNTAYTLKKLDKYKSVFDEE